MVQLGVTALLARLLTPDDFGLVAMVLSLFGVGELLRDAGLSDASIRLERLPEGLRNNLFWINVVVGTTLGLLAVALLPLLANFYDQPSVVAVGLGFAPMFLLSALSAQHRVGLQRTGAFGRLALADLTAMVVGSAAAVGAAAFGLGVASLVLQMYVTALLTMVLLWSLGGWWPGRPCRGQGTRAVVGMGSHFLGSTLLTYLSLNIDSIVTGRSFGTATLGQYNRASTLIRTPARQVAAPVRSVMLPVLTRGWADRGEAMVLARRAQLLSTLPVIPLVVLAAGAPAALVSVVLGPGWDQAATVAPFLAVSQLFGAVGGVVALMLVVGGHGRQLLGLSALSTGVDVVLVVFGARFGVLGVATAVAVAPAVSWAATVVVARRATHLPVGRLVTQGLTLVVTTLLGVALARVTVALLGGPALLHLVVAIVCSLVAVGPLFLLPATRQDMVLGTSFLTAPLRRGRDAPQPGP